MLKERPEISKEQMEIMLKKQLQGPTGVIGKNPVTPDPPPPMPEFSLATAAAKKRSLRLSRYPELKKIRLKDLCGEVVITEKKGTKLRISGTLKNK